MEKVLSNYYYKVYGLNVISEIEMKEFVSNNDCMEEDVRIVYGTVSDEIQEQIHRGQEIEILENQIWFNIEGTAIFSIENGNRIVIMPHENADFEDIRVFIMGSCLGFIMLQRGQVAIHGGTVEKDGKAIILTGDKGAGKSTLTTALRMKGYKFLSDDVAAVSIEEKTMIKPGFPYQKLCKDAMEQMGYNQTMCKTIKGDTEDKYLVPVHEYFIERDTNLSAIVEICKGDVEQVEIEPVIGREKLAQITNNLFRGEYIPYLRKKDTNYFKQCLKIAESVQYYRMTRPTKGFTVEEQIKLIESMI